MRTTHVLPATIAPMRTALSLVSLLAASATALAAQAPAAQAHTGAAAGHHAAPPVRGIASFPDAISRKRTVSTSVPFTPSARSERPRAMNGSSDL